ncbi:MAG: HdaA/DnaA family protein [Alphaproteobacteria bacterium]
MTRQLPLALQPRAGSHDREDLAVGPPNREALAWIDAWPAWPGGGLVLHGPEGSGKSHLASIWAARACAGRISLQAPLDRIAALARPALLLEDADRALAEGGAAEAALFHAYNLVVQAGGTLLLTAREPAPRWGVALADLRSRMQALPAAELKPPDDAMLAAVLSKLFADRQIPPDREVVHFIAARVERRLSTLGAVVDELDRAALAAGRGVTLPFVRQVLREKRLFD